MATEEKGKRVVCIIGNGGAGVAIREMVSEAIRHGNTDVVVIDEHREKEIPVIQDFKSCVVEVEKECFVRSADRFKGKAYYKSMNNKCLKGVRK